mmetsp:Transcript_47837/g.74691  ORF Transcript_47837/g.74691 Transcript_47837/m.74691 type:complete len:153 (-) Transcript_47837:450-908(-)
MATMVSEAKVETQLSDTKDEFKQEGSGPQSAGSSRAVSLNVFLAVWLQPLNPLARKLSSAVPGLLGLSTIQIPKSLSLFMIFSPIEPLSTHLSTLFLKGVCSAYVPPKQFVYWSCCWMVVSHAPGPSAREVPTFAGVYSIGEDGPAPHFTWI